MKPAIENRINDQLGLSPMPEQLPEKVEIVSDGVITTGNSDTDADLDLIHSRQNLRLVLEKAQEAIDMNLSIARAGSENPKLYEALAEILQATVAASQTLMQVHKIRREIEKKSGTEPTTLNQTAVFVGTNADLCRYLKEQILTIEHEIIK